MSCDASNSRKEMLLKEERSLIDSMLASHPSQEQFSLFDSLVSDESRVSIHYLLLDSEVRLETSTTANEVTDEVKAIHPPPVSNSTATKPSESDQPRSRKYHCQHNRYKYVCKECNGSGICHHNKIKRTCVDCQGSATCQHKRIRYYCKDCNGLGQCPHKANKHCCVICKPSIICQHGQSKYICSECKQ
jgi:hypothetical protein